MYYYVIVFLYIFEKSSEIQISNNVLSNKNNYLITGESLE